MDAIDAFLKDLKQCPRFNREEERRLWERSRKDDNEARDLLVRSVLPFAFQVAKRFVHDIEEASSLAGLAAIRAVEKFQPNKGRLTTYVQWWSRRFALDYYYCHSSVITVPMYAAERLMEGIDDQAARSAHAARNPVSLDLLRASADQNAEPTTLAEQVADSSLTTPITTLIETEAADFKQERLRYLDYLLSQLPDRNRRVLVGRSRGELLETIAGWFGVTKERIRQIELDAKRELFTLATKEPFSRWRRRVEEASDE